MGIVAISQMAAGDGMADIVGRSATLRFKLSFLTVQNVLIFLISDFPHYLQAIRQEKMALCTHEEHCGLGRFCRGGLSSEHCAAGADELHR